MRKNHNVEQRSPEWFDLRSLRMTASNAQAIGSNEKGLETYISTLMSEYYSTAPKEHFGNEHTDRGNELESDAVSLYEMQTDNIVNEIGFVTDDAISKHAGASPDGEIEGQNKGIEVKCISDSKYFLLMLDDEVKVESKHLWQMQMQMLMCGYESIDYIVYNPNYSPSLLIKTIYPDKEKLESLKLGIKSGEKMIKEIKKKYKKIHESK